jgi:hypothetical protein
MVCQYLEKMGTLTKFFLTRFVRQGLSGRETPREFDIQTGLELPLYTCVNRIGRSNFNYKLVLQPMCVKDYGEELNKAFIYGASGNRVDLYNATYYGMSESELINNNSGIYGDPDWDENIYQEGFERYRQKYIEYTQKGIWKSKEVNAQSLIYFHDLFLNKEWENWYNEIESNTRSKYPNFQSDLNGRDRTNTSSEAFTIAYSQENTKWFEIWITISANTIRHKLDIYNSNNPRKTFQAIFKDLESILDDINLLISSETFTPLSNDFENWKNSAVQYYRLDDPKKYCENRIDEMTYFAKQGCFATSDEDIEKRGLEAKRLKSELIKM